MIGLISFGHLLSKRKLVETGFFESDGKCFHGFVRLERHRRDHGTRIDTATQESSERDIGQRADANGLVEKLAQFPAGIVFAQSWRTLFGRRRPAPVGSL